MITQKQVRLLNHLNNNGGCRYGDLKRIYNTYAGFHGAIVKLETLGFVSRYEWYGDRHYNITLKGQWWLIKHG